jgi:hypothetical protein
MIEAEPNKDTGLLSPIVWPGFAARFRVISVFVPSILSRVICLA